MKLRHLLLGRKAVTNLDSMLKSRDITLLTNVYIFKAMVSPIVMFQCKSWTIKKAECQRTDAFQLWCWRRLLDCKEIQPIHAKENQSWIFIGRTDSEAETPVLWPPHAKSWLVGKDWCWEKIECKKKGETEAEMVGWHHRLNGHAFEQTLGDGEGQGSLACCSLWVAES